MVALAFRTPGRDGGDRPPVLARRRCAGGQRTARSGGNRWPADGLALLGLAQVPTPKTGYVALAVHPGSGGSPAIHGTDRAESLF